MPDIPQFSEDFAPYEQVQAATAEPDPHEVARQLAEARAAQAVEWNTFVAAETIYWGTAVAYLPGHAVPVSSVSDTGPVYPRQVALRPTEEQLALAANTPSAEALPRPAGNAGVDEWRTYAVAQGIPAEEAAKLGRDELRSRLGAA